MNNDYFGARETFEDIRWHQTHSDIGNVRMLRTFNERKNYLICLLPRSVLECPTTEKEHNHPIGPLCKQARLILANAKHH